MNCANLDKAIQAILDGVPGAQLKDRIGQFEDRKAELTAFLANANEPPPLLHPNMAETYRQRIAGLDASLQTEDDRRGELAGILRFDPTKRTPASLRKPGFSRACYRKDRWLRGQDLNL